MFDQIYIFKPSDFYAHMYVNIGITMQSNNSSCMPIGCLGLVSCTLIVQMYTKTLLWRLVGARSFYISEIYNSD